AGGDRVLRVRALLHVPPGGREPEVLRERAAVEEALLVEVAEEVLGRLLHEALDGGRVAGADERVGVMRVQREERAQRFAERRRRAAEGGRGRIAVAADVEGAARVHAGAAARRD